MKILTKTENKVAHLISNGFLYKEIADSMCISVHTVHTHLKNIRTKTGAKNIADVTRNYILSLDNPKAVFKALLFLIIQLSVIYGQPDIDLRRGQRNRIAKHKIVRNGRTRVYFS